MEVRLQMSPAAFNETFEEMLPKYKTQRAAYEAVESIHEQLTGQRKYIDHHSFTNVRQRRMSKKK